MSGPGTETRRSHCWLASTLLRPIRDGFRFNRRRVGFQPGRGSRLSDGHKGQVDDEADTDSDEDGVDSAAAMQKSVQGNPLYCGRHAPAY